MQAAIRVQPEEHHSQSKTFQAAVCKHCGAKLYPMKLLRSHLTRHQLKQRWFMTELKKLQYTMSRMRDIA
jgi:hypothetical protein